MNVALYLRKSRADLEAEKTGEFETLNKHKSTLLDLSREMKLNVVEIKEELVSGESIIHRPKMIELLKEVESNKYDAVLVMDIDRLGRGDMKDQGIILETFKESDTKIITPRKTYDLLDEFDEEYSEFEAFMARKELKLITRRMQRGLIKSIEDGNYLYRLPPYGYDIFYTDKRERILVPNDQADIVRLVFDLYINENMGSTKISDYLNNRGIKTYTGCDWYGSAVRNIINNKIYCGYIERKKKTYSKIKDTTGKRTVKNNDSKNRILVKGKHEPIISEEAWNQAQKIIKTKGHVGLKNELKNPFSGIIKCKLCGKYLSYRPNKNRATQLICSNKCGNKGSKFVYIEESFFDSLRSSLNLYKIKTEKEDISSYNVNYEKELNKKALLDLENELKELSKQRNKLFKFFERGIYDEDTFLVRSQYIKNEIIQNNKNIEIVKSRLKNMDKDNNVIAIGNREILELYPVTESIVEKNKLLKSVVKYATYQKSKDQRLDDFELHIELKISEE